jgi:hypothetical protein
MKAKAKGATMKEAGAALLNPTATAGDALDAITGSDTDTPRDRRPKRAPSPSSSLVPALRRGPVHIAAVPSRYRDAVGEVMPFYERKILTQVSISDEIWETLAEVAYARTASRRRVRIDKSAVVREILDRWIDGGCDISALEALGPAGIRELTRTGDTLWTSFSLEQRQLDAILDAARMLVVKRLSRRDNKSVVVRHILEEGLRELRSDVRESRKKHRTDVKR